MRIIRVGVSYQGIALAIPQISELRRPFRGWALDEASSQGARDSFPRCRHYPKSKHAPPGNRGMAPQLTRTPNTADPKHNPAQRKQDSPAEYPEKLRVIIAKAVNHQSVRDRRNCQQSRCCGKSEPGQGQDRRHSAQSCLIGPPCPTPNQHYGRSEISDRDQNSKHHGHRSPTPPAYCMPAALPSKMLQIYGAAGTRSPPRMNLSTAPRHL